MAAVLDLTQSDPNEPLDWLVRHRRGEPGAFEALVKELKGPVHNYLARCGIDETTREDLSQEVFSRVLRAADRYQGQGNLKGWVMTIAVNTLRDHLRRVRPEIMAEDPGTLPEAHSSDPSPLAEIEGLEAAQWLEAAIARLPFSQREAIVLRCVERMDYAEIASALEIPVNTVKTNVRRARLTLAKSWDRRRMRAKQEVGHG